MKSLYSKSCKWSNFVFFPRGFHLLSCNKLKKVKHYAKKVSCLEKCPLNNFDKANFCKLRKGTNGFHQMMYNLKVKNFFKMDSNNVLEKACNQESQNNKDFYSEWGTVQRILRCDTYFTNFATVAFKKVIVTYH